MTTLISASKVLAKVIYKLSLLANIDFHNDSGKTESDIIAKVNFHIYLRPSSKTKLSIELAEKATQLASSMARMF